MKPGQLASKTEATRARIAAWVAEHPRCNLSEVSRGIGLTRPTVAIHLAALVAALVLRYEVDARKYSAR